MLESKKEKARKGRRIRLQNAMNEVNGICENNFIWLYFRLVFHLLIESSLLLYFFPHKVLCGNVFFSNFNVEMGFHVDKLTNFNFFPRFLFWVECDLLLIIYYELIRFDPMLLWMELPDNQQLYIILLGKERGPFIKLIVTLLDYNGAFRNHSGYKLEKNIFWSFNFESNLHLVYKFKILHF